MYLQPVMLMLYCSKMDSASGKGVDRLSCVFYIEQSARNQPLAKTTKGEGVSKNNILGFYCFGRHDSSVSLVRNGNILAAAEEERHPASQARVAHRPRKEEGPDHQPHDLLPVAPERGLGVRGSVGRESGTREGAPARGILGLGLLYGGSMPPPPPFVSL